MLETNTHEYKYLDLIRNILTHGHIKHNRTGVETIGLFGESMRFHLGDGTIPLLTTKKMHTKSIIHEILWYLKGSDNIKYLNDNGVTIWDEWADPQGNLGPVYGVQWRAWQDFEFVPPHSEGYEWVDETYRVGHIDQIAQLIDKLKNNPLDRRMIVSAWNVAEISEMALPPCHYSFQCYARPMDHAERVGRGLSVERFYINHDIEPTAGQLALLDELGIPKYELSMIINQRSCDVGLGVPFNIVQYSILLRMIAEVVGMAAGDLIWNGGDVHIYKNHVESLREQVKLPPFPAPTLRFKRKVTDIDDFKFEDFSIENYTSHPAIKLEVAI